MALRSRCTFVRRDQRYLVRPAGYGDILEIGAFAGKSAIVLASFLDDPVNLHICDPFDDAVSDDSNKAENSDSYPGLSRDVFEYHFSQWHSKSPSIHQCTFDKLGARLEGRTFRMVHVDGSHLYPIVQTDIDPATSVLVPDGVIIFDDYRTYVGVGAAIWEAIGAGKIRPVLATPSKLDCDLNGSIDWRTQLLAKLDMSGSIDMNIESVHEYDVVIATSRPNILLVSRIVRNILPVGVDRLRDRARVRRQRIRSKVVGI